MNVTKALAVSSDVFYYWLGERFWDGRGKYGTSAIQDVARSMGMGVYTDVDLPFESNGRVSDPPGREKLHKDYPEAFPYPEWYTGDNLNIAVGQGDTAITPLQLANSYATFANGGTVFAPQVGEAVIDRQGKELRRIEPKVIGRTELPAGVWDPVQAGFVGVVGDPAGNGLQRLRRLPAGRLPGRREDGHGGGLGQG